LGPAIRQVGLLVEANFLNVIIANLRLTPLILLYLTFIHYCCFITININLG